MSSKIYQNSYIVAIITFILLCIIFFLFEIGYSAKINEKGEIEKKFSWKYPLAISLLVWLIWYYVIFPRPNNSITQPNEKIQNDKNYMLCQKISMDNWN